MAHQTESRHERHRNVNGSTKPQEPPPSSILAAHLAPVNGSAASFNFDRESFTQLLKESLGLDEEGQPNLGNDATINHKLIGVIVKAGLDHALDQPRDPFVADDEESETALEAHKCLDVIELAITRCPPVVYQLSGENEPREGDRDVPLFIWLIPKLLRLLSCRNLSSVKFEEKVWSVLECARSVDTKCGQSARFCKSIRQYLQQLVNGMCFSLSLSS